MQTNIEVTTKFGVMLVVDSARAIEPPPVASAGFVDYFRAMIENGQAFLLESEDPRLLRIRVASDGDCGQLPSFRTPEPSGAYLLYLPSGAFAIHDGVRQLSRDQIHAGYYALTVRVLSAEAVDGKAYAREEEAMLGEKNWRAYQRRNRLGLLGCLPLAVLPIALLIFKWSFASFIALAMCVLMLLALRFLGRTRDTEIESRRAELDTKYPDVLITLKAIDTPNGLVGGRVVL